MASEPQPPDPQDELKRKFREALERKQGKATDRASAEESGESSKAAHAHGPAKAQRTFRRRSGGG